MTADDIWEGFADADAADPPPEVHRGNLRLAERLARRYGSRLRHAHGFGWLAWDGARFAPDRDGAAMRAAVDTVKAALNDLTHLEGKQRDELFADVRKTESAGALEGMLRIAAALPPLAVSVDQLDADPHLFNVANGTLDLLAGTIRPHNPSDLITKIAGCGFDPDAKSAAFDRFLREVLPDAEVRDYVRRLLGYAMLGAVRDHILPVWKGNGGNGKGTLLELAVKVFGSYAIEAEPDLLVDRGTTHPTGQADLLGVRLAVCSETDEGRRLAAATVKRLTGGDRMRARRMRADFIEWTPSHTVILMTNHAPKVQADDAAMWRRLHVVPFDVTFDNPDTRLGERLALELPAVLAWCWQGWLDYAANGLAPPAAVTERTAAYRTDSDAIARFLDERTIATSDNGTTPARALFHAWTDWCKDSGEQPGSEVTFADAMRRRNHEKTKRHGVMTYLGIILANTETESPWQPE
ncbi:MAG TPA: phage/plasmid primase, P4 family [Acidothermaceae bacterium]|jgi:putative DNA primase/helicase